MTPFRKTALSEFDPLSVKTPDAKSDCLIDFNTPKSVLRPPYDKGVCKHPQVSNTAPSLLDIPQELLKFKYTEEDLDQAKDDVRQEVR
jgi:hypothetical protein